MILAVTLNGVETQSMFQQETTSMQILREKKPRVHTLYQRGKKVRVPVVTMPHYEEALGPESQYRTSPL